MTDNMYERLSQERKEQQAKGNLPEWYSTAGYQFFKSKYQYKAPHWKAQIERICHTAAKHTTDPDYWFPKFFDAFWKGWLSPSTPVLANMGTDRGLPVSCSGLTVSDSIQGFYESATEVAILSKWGFGTSGDLSQIRPRGSSISRGGEAHGVIPVIKNMINVCKDVSQGGTRRGSGAWYVDIEGDDFKEVLGFLEANPDDFNLGWIIKDSFIERLDAQDEEALDRFQEALKVKMTLGKGYFFFVDKANRQRPATYKDMDLLVRASNLCTEIMLHSSDEYTYTCVLSSAVVARYDEWKETDFIFTATVFIDCVCSEFIELAQDIKWLHKAVDFTRKSRALGLGQLGLFSLFQKRGIPPESFEAHMLNIEVAKHIQEQSEQASQWMAREFGEPDWCVGYGRRNTHLQAIAPTKSTASLMGGWSEGINPDPAMAFSASGAAGDIDRVCPPLLEVIKKKGLDVDKCIKDVLSKKGSVQEVDWLTDDEKSVFKTAFEIDQHVLIRYAATRQKYIDQGQSVNLFFAHDDTEEYVSSVHQEAFKNENILSLYYVYSSSEISAERTGECEACQ